MSKRLIVVLALLFVVGATFAAYAEVQNVKVSGDIVASGVARDHFNLDPGVIVGDKSILKERFLMSQVRVRIDADLTDNVMSTVRLINERIWNGQNDGQGTANTIDLDLAYVALKEFLYSPLSLTVGRQEIRFGNGLVMGNAKVANTGVVTIPTDLTERKAFDSIRATLNYDPLIVDMVYAKIKQEQNDGNNNPDRKDVDLLGINATYALTKKTNVSAYYYHKRDNFKSTPLGVASDARGKADILNTVGALVTSSPIENLSASLEGALQWGRADYNNIPRQNEHRAWAIQAMTDYTLAKVKTTPKIGASYTYLSGDRNTNAKVSNGWDPMFYDQKLNNIVYTLLPFTNMHAFNLKASCKPMDDVTLAAVYGFYEVAQKPTATTQVNAPFSKDGNNLYEAANYTGKKHLGDALDLTAIYNYTEDVEFALTGGWFKPGDALSTNQKNATQLIGSMKVTF